MCRSRRFTRFRVTALPTFLDTTKPTRVTPGGSSLVRRRTCTTTDGAAARDPRLTAAAKSIAAFSRWGRGSTVYRRSGRQLGATLAATVGQDGAAGAGTHPGAEAVGAAAPTVAGLESALAHGTDSLILRLTRLPAQGQGEGASRRRRPPNDTCCQPVYPNPSATRRHPAANCIDVVQPTRRWASVFRLHRAGLATRFGGHSGYPQGLLQRRDPTARAGQPQTVWHSYTRVWKTMWRSPRGQISRERGMWWPMPRRRISSRYGPRLSP